MSRMSVKHWVLWPSFAALGCLPLPPQQMRVAQVETYEARFCLGDDTNYDFKKRGRIYEIVFGDYIDPEYGVKYGDMLADMMNAALRGHLILTLSIHPGNKDLFFMGGHGRHVIYKIRGESTHEVIGSAKFVVADDGPRSLDDLKSQKHLPIRVAALTTRENVRTAFRSVHCAYFVVDIPLTVYSDKKNEKETIYSVDYRAPFFIYLIANETGPAPPPGAKKGCEKAAGHRAGAEGVKLELWRIGVGQFDGKLDGRHILDPGLLKATVWGAGLTEYVKISPEVIAAAMGVADRPRDWFEDASRTNMDAKCLEKSEP